MVMNKTYLACIPGEGKRAAFGCAQDISLLFLSCSTAVKIESPAGRIDGVVRLYIPVIEF
jgi:hypothetical protein